MQKNILPSKKMITILALLGVVVVAIYGVKVYVTHQKSKPSIEKISISDQNIESLQDIVVNADSDGDGLKDWEEDLWGLDKNKKDTDGDGEPDFEYVKNQRAQVQEDLGVEDESITEIDIFVRNLYLTTQYLESTGSLSTQEKAEIAATVEGFLSGTPPKALTPIAIKNIVASSEESLLAYLGSMTTIANKYQIQDGRLFRLFEAAQNEPESVGQFQDLLDDHLGFLGEMMQLDVPGSIDVEHIQLANAVQDMIFVIYNVLLIEKDPVYGIRGTVHYANVIDNIDIASQNISNSIINN